MTIERPDYPAELARIARAALDPDNPGDFLSEIDGVTLREAASELARLTLSEATLRGRVEALTGRIREGLAEVTELYEELDGFRHPHGRPTGLAGDPS